MQQLIIKLSPKLTARYLSLARKMAQVEMANDMMVSGVSLSIEVGLIPSFEILEKVMVDGEELPCEYNDVEVSLEDGH